MNLRILIRPRSTKCQVYLKKIQFCASDLRFLEEKTGSRFYQNTLYTVPAQFSSVNVF